MKTTLFMATSLNGYITAQNDDTDWVKDTQVLADIISAKGDCLMGRRTYDICLHYNDFPFKNALNIVITHDQKLIDQSTEAEIFTDATPTTVLKQIESMGHDELIILGGGKINSLFLSANLIDEIIIDVHPLIIDEGIQLFDESFPRTNLKLIETKNLFDDIIQIKYKVIK
ncbi:MAG: dihydrofolate reductase family protein [bacterium]